ncbi:MAG: glycosyl hydrolase-related protein [Candidatus Latescibacterota bacterium]
MENRFFRVGLDPRTGAVASLFDKELGRELVDAVAPHGLHQLVVRRVASGALETGQGAVIRPLSRGPVCTGLRITTSAPTCPQVTQEIVLYDEVKRVDLATRLLKDSTPAVELYFAFPFAAPHPVFHFEGSHSVIRPQRDQFPGSNSNYYSVQHWAEVSSDGVGIVLAPREAHLLEFGGLWPCYVSQAHHGVTPPDFGRPFVGPEDLTRGHVYAFVLDANFRTNFQPTQQGDLLWRYSLTAHAGGWESGWPAAFGWGAANPLEAALCQGPQAGVRPPCGSFCQVDSDHVLVTALKRAEDGEGLILRLTEVCGQEAEVTLALPSLALRRAWRTDLVERQEAVLPCREHEVSVRLGAFAIATVRVEG